MYQYFNGFVIREGTDGILTDFVESLFKDGWMGKKYSIVAKRKILTHL